MSGRDCSYASQAPPEQLPLSASNTASQDESASPSNKHSSSTSSQPDDTPLNASLTNHDRHKDRCIDPNQDSTLYESVNSNHTELLLHLLTDSSMFNLGARVNNYTASIPFALRLGLNHPYYLHELLAFSARHLAYLHPTSTVYPHQACALQTRAISLFNASLANPPEKPKLDESNCIPALLFSVILGHHLLADTLSLLTNPCPDVDVNADTDKAPDQKLQKLNTFLTHYTNSASLYRGIHTITLTTWPSLIHTPLLGPIISQSATYTSSTPQGTRTHALHALISTSPTLSSPDKQACLTALRYLQLGFDALNPHTATTTVNAEGEGEGEGYPSNPYEMLFLFHVLAPPAFTELLAARRPEALAVMGYYALLLQEGGRGMWQVGEAGKELAGLLRGKIGIGGEGEGEGGGWAECLRGVV